MTLSTGIRLIAVILVCATVGHAQQPIGVPVAPLGNGPFILDTAEQPKIRVSVVTKELSHPWGMAFLPDGSMLVTERPGRLRVVRVAGSSAGGRSAGLWSGATRWADGYRAPSEVR